MNINNPMASSAEEPPKSDPRSMAKIAPLMRRRVFEVLRQSEKPIDAATVAEELCLHVTTARFHLDHLENDGVVSRAPAAESRRGRPRILYRVVDAAREDDAREQLISILAEALIAGDSTGQQALQAGAQWADAFPEVSTDAARDLTNVLNQLGFAPERRVGTIALHACPFRTAARAHPEVVCGAHRGLVQRVLDRADSGVTGELLPFVEPELCLVTLGGHEPQSEQ